MTSTLTVDPVHELETVATCDGLDTERVITVGDDTALVSYRHPHQVITDIWVRREAAWRFVASHTTTDA